VPAYMRHSAIRERLSAPPACDQHNALNSPWVLDDITQILSTVGTSSTVIMLPSRGPCGIHYLDQLLAPARRRAPRTRHVVGRQT